MTIKSEHMESAQKAANEAMKEHLKKLGYEKYPETKLTMKTEETKKADDDEAAAAAKKKKEEDDKVSKEAILKEDGSLNLNAVPAEMRPVFEVIAKQQAAFETRAKAAEVRAEGLEKVLKENKDSSRKAEIVRKSSEFKNLNQEDVAKTLELADKVSTEEFDRVHKMFLAQDKQIGEGKLFGTIGSAQSVLKGGAADAWSKIEAAATTVVEKSAGKVSKEQAIASFMETSEGQRLYAEHQASRPNGI